MMDTGGDRGRVGEGGVGAAEAPTGGGGGGRGGNREIPAILSLPRGAAALAAIARILAAAIGAGKRGEGKIVRAIRRGGGGGRGGAIA